MDDRDNVFEEKNTKDTSTTNRSKYNNINIKICFNIKILMVVLHKHNDNSLCRKTQK